MLKQTVMAVLALALLAVSAQAAFAGHAPVVVGEADAGTTARVAIGQLLVVRLPGNAGNGYQWFIDGDPTPELILSGRKMESVAMPGGPLTTIFTYTAESPGTVTLKAKYIRTWEKDRPPARTYVLTVTVTP